MVTRCRASAASSGWPRSTYTRRPRTSSSTSPETRFEARVDPPGAGPRRRGIVVVAAWVAGLGTVVAIALWGAASPGAATPAPAAVAIVPVQPRATPERSIRIDQPARRDEVVRTREIVVRGQVTKGVSQVWITLESGGRPIATESVDPIGMPRNNLIPFETRFTVDRPRPAGPLFVMVVAIDADGVPIDAMRRRFMLGEWLELRGPVGNTSPND